MANFTESQITDMMKFIKDYGGIDPDNITRELAILELEDIKRKGCTCESIGRECMGCSAKEGDHKCPMDDWEKRHPEYKNDDLAMRIKILEAGGEEAYKEKMKRQEELLKKAEEKKQAVDIAKQKLFQDLIMKKFAMTDDDTTKWTETFEAHLEAYVQARIANNN